MKTQKTFCPFQGPDNFILSKFLSSIDLWKKIFFIAQREEKNSIQKKLLQMCHTYSRSQKAGKIWRYPFRSYNYKLGGSQPSHLIFCSVVVTTCRRSQLLQSWSQRLSDVRVLDQYRSALLSMLLLWVKNSVNERSKKSAFRYHQFYIQKLTNIKLLGVTDVILLSFVWPKSTVPIF